MTRKQTFNENSELQYCFSSKSNNNIAVDFITTKFEIIGRFLRDKLMNLLLKSCLFFLSVHSLKFCRTYLSHIQTLKKIFFVLLSIFAKCQQKSQIIHSSKPRKFEIAVFIMSNFKTLIFIKNPTITVNRFEDDIPDERTHYYNKTFFFIETEPSG